MGICLNVNVFSDEKYFVETFGLSTSVMSQHSVVNCCNSIYKVKNSVNFKKLSFVKVVIDCYFCSCKKKAFYVNENENLLWVSLFVVHKNFVNISIQQFFKYL